MSLIKKLIKKYKRSPVNSTHQQINFFRDCKILLFLPTTISSINNQISPQYLEQHE